MSSILTFGVEWETKLLVVNHTDAVFSEKVPYLLGNGNTNPKNHYSLEKYYPPRKPKERAAESAVYTPYCMYALEFIFGVFNNPGEFSAAMKEFIRVIEQNLCTPEQPALQITDRQNQVRQHPIVSIIDFVKHKPEGLHNVYTDCSLTNQKHVGGEEPPNNVGVYFANHCPILGRAQVTIGVTLESTGKLFSYLIHEPLSPPDTEFNVIQNFRDSSFKMASNFLFNVMDATDNPEVNVVCLEMIYAIMNIYRSTKFAKGVEYFKMLLPIKPRTNITCLISQLSVPQQQIFNQWYEQNELFLGKHFPRVRGYVFGQDYPELNISTKFIYSAEIASRIAGVTDVAIVGDNITFNNGGNPSTLVKTMIVIPEQLLVWYRVMPKLEAILSPDGNNILFQGIGNPAFTSADVNEWCTAPHDGSTYNILEVRELGKYLGLGRDVKSIQLGELENVIGRCVTNLDQVCTHTPFNLKLEPGEYTDYYTEYIQQDPHAQAKVVDVMVQATGDYHASVIEALQEGLDEDAGLGGVAESDDEGSMDEDTDLGRLLAESDDDGWMDEEDL